MAPVPSQLASMERLADAMRIHRPSPSGAPNSSKNPRLVLFLGWMNARESHLARYMGHYQRLFPHSTILLLRCTLADVMFGPVASKHMAPAVEHIRAIMTDDPEPESPEDTSTTEPHMLIHLFSGGSCLLYHLYVQFAKSAKKSAKSGAKELQSVMPRHITVFDSSPGVFSYDFSISMMRADIPRELWIPALPVVYAVTTIWWLYYIVLRVPDPQRLWSDAHNDPLTVDEARRTYIYGDADEIWKSHLIETHAAQAKERGFAPRLELFKGSGHVAHMKMDPDRYWRIVEETWYGDSCPPRRVAS